MGLYARVINVLSFNVVQTIASKGLAFLNLAILIRLLATEEIGIIGLAGGYVALLGFILVLPESVFIRDFPKIKNKINQYLSSFFAFSLLRSGVLLLLGGIVAAWLGINGSDPRLPVYFMLLVGSTVLTSLSGPFREAFYANFRQARIALIDLSLNVLSIISLALLYFSQDVITYGILQVVVALIGIGWWYQNAHSKLGFTFTLFPGWMALSWASIQGFALWNHFSGIAIRLVSQSDIVILGFFSTLTELGNYSVALTISGVFFVFPQLVQKAASLSFSQSDANTANPVMLGAVVRYNTLFSLAQFLAYIIAGPFLLPLLVPEHFNVVWEYSLYLVGGVTLYNLARPWLSLIVIKVNPMMFFFQLFLIPCTASVVIYWFFAAEYGALGVAQANMLAYGLLGVMTILYARYKIKTTPSFKLLPFETRALARVRKMILGKINYTARRSSTR